MSMYRQLWLAIILSTLLALAGALVASLLGARGYLEEQLTQKNADNATAVALSLSQQNPDPVQIELTVAALFDSGHYESIRFTDPLGKLVVERVAKDDDRHAPDWFVASVPIRAVPGQAGISSGWTQLGTITVVSHRRFAYRALWQGTLRMIGALGLAGLFAGYLGSLVLRRLKAPLRNVIAQAGAIIDRRFVRIDLPDVPELRQLAVAMNTTVDRLRAMFDEAAGRLEALRREANLDQLTGLANRMHFMAVLRESLHAEDGIGGVLVLIRIPRLGEVNQRLGRAAADEWLKRVGTALAAVASADGETLAARLNGADFALLLPPQADRHQVETLLAAVVLESEAYLDGGPAAFAGFGKFSPKTDDPGALLARVDAALAGAEASGFNVARAAASADEALPRSADEWSVMIRQALDSGRVRLMSYPVKQCSGALSHRECPLRLMFEAEGEWLPAGRFLPVAERLKLTPALDLAAVARGLGALEQDMQLAGLAINLSAGSLESAGFRDQLRQLLESGRTVANRLWLEIPEAGVLKHLEAFRAICACLRPFGCRIGIEHFGRQFSQIGLIHDLGLDYIKVDSCFISGIDTHPGNQAFLKGLTAIAHGIGMQVFAQGVRSDDELKALAALGFDGATGPAITDNP